MSDYASCVTEPFWPDGLPEAHAYFLAGGWTRIEGDKGSVAFARVFRDLSDNGILDQVRGVALDLAQKIPIEADLRLCLLDEVARINLFSVLDARKQAIEYKRLFDLRQREAAARDERAERDRIANEDEPNPSLDAFLG